MDSAAAKSCSLIKQPQIMDKLSSPFGFSKRISFNLSRKTKSPTERDLKIISMKLL